MNFDTLHSLVLASPGFAPEPIQTPSPRSSFDHPGDTPNLTLRPKQSIPRRSAHRTPPDKQPPRVITTQTHTPQPSTDASTTPIASAKSLLSSIERTLVDPADEKTVFFKVDRDTFNELESLITEHERLEKLRCPS
jgi:hypothetical protein